MLNRISISTTLPTSELQKSWVSSQRELKMHHFNHTHLSVQQTRCGCPDAPVAFLPASHLDSPGEEIFGEIKFHMNQKHVFMMTVCQLKNVFDWKRITQNISDNRSYPLLLHILQYYLIKRIYQLIRAWILNIDAPLPPEVRANLAHTSEEP